MPMIWHAMNRGRRRPALTLFRARFVLPAGMGRRPEGKTTCQRNRVHTGRAANAEVSRVVPIRPVRQPPMILSYTVGFPQSPLDVKKNHTVSRRIEPNSRTTLMDEQSNPFNRLQLKDVMSRHRGVKPARRYGLLELINLLSPAYLLSDDQNSFHVTVLGLYRRLASLFGW